MWKNYNYAGVLYNDVLFPQDIRNCTKCHDGSATSTAQTAQGNNWMNVPSRKACGACHDGKTTYLGKPIFPACSGARKLDESGACRRCHTAPDAAKLEREYEAFAAKQKPRFEGN